MIVMHSTFNLAHGVSDDDFKDAFTAFARHLWSKRLITRWRVMRRQPHDGYNANEPRGNYYLMTEFADLAQAQTCWKYVEQDEPPIHALHRAVREKIIDTSFFLSADL